MRTSLLLGLATLPILFSGLSAQAETAKSANSGAIAQSAVAKPIATVESQKLSFPKTAPQSHSTTTLAQLVSPIAVNSAAKPIPGKALTSASALLARPSKTVAPIAQVDTTTPGTITPGTITPKITRERGSPVFLNRGGNATRADLSAFKTSCPRFYQFTDTNIVFLSFIR